MKRFTGALVAGGLLLAALPAAAQSSIRPGDVVRGALTGSDPVMEDGSHFDCYALAAPAGQRIGVTLVSPAFDAYLAVHEGSCDEVDTVKADDDSAGGTDSLVRLTLGSGRYFVRANSLDASETGAYTLSVSTLPPAPVLAPVYLGSASTGVEGELADGDAVLPDESFYDCYVFDARSGQTARITLRSDDFDAWLSLHEGEACDSEIESDDDGLGEGTDSLLEWTFERGGRYSVRANSLGGGEIGAYRLTLDLR